MTTRPTSILLKILMMGFIMYVGYNLTYNIAPAETSTLYKIGFITWGYLIMALAVTGLIGSIKNTYFPRRSK